MADLTPISALLIDLEATELREQLPTLADTLYEAPYVAHMIQMLVNDTFASASRRRDDGQLCVDHSVLAVRLGAWRKCAEDALAIAERP